MEIKFFKNKEMEEGAGVTDLINRIVQVLKKDLYWVKISTQNAELIKPIKPYVKFYAGGAAVRNALVHIKDILIKPV